MDHFGLFEEDSESLQAAAITQQSLVDTQEKLGAMLDAMPIGLLIHTEQGILFANKEACGLLKITKEQALGQHFLDYVRASDAPEVTEQLEAAFSGLGKTNTHECVVERRDGMPRLLKIISGRLPWDGNPVIQLLLQDITDQKRAETSLRQLTITDELTGAYNRRQAMYEAALYTGTSGTARIPLSVILIDIDHFKRINDTYGHAIGDIALKELTRVAHGFIPTIAGTDSALFARIGGEEFVILLPGLERAAARTVAEQFRRAVARMHIALPNADLTFTISLGVSEFRTEDGDFETMLARADAALYAAKEGGRNRVSVAP